MAFSRFVVACLLLALLTAAHAADSLPAVGGDALRLQAAGTGIGSSLSIDCSSECARRCRLSSRPNLCKRACGTCCYRCHCVPPGTAGNKEACPCYARMTTHGGRPKCP